MRKGYYKFCVLITMFLLGNSLMLCHKEKKERVFQSEADVVTWIGSSIGTPGYLNLSSGIKLYNFAVSSDVGLIYPYLKTAQVRLMYAADNYDYTPFSFGISGGYLEKGDYKSATLGLLLQGFFNENWILGIGPEFFFNYEDKIYPLSLSLNISYVFSWDWGERKPYQDPQNF